jgi:predicted alpha/beta-hydrolase family hydrolase
MMELRSLDVVGYKNEPIPNTFIAQPGSTKHLGIILPGYRYPAEMPPLYYAAQVLSKQGADVLRVDYAYNRTNFAEQSAAEQEKWISSDVMAACNAALSQRSYEKLTLVGKSLGTLAMGHLLSDKRLQRASCAWLTPILTAEWLCSRIEQLRPRSLFIIGTADQFYDPDLLAHLETVTRGHAMVIEGANHGLEVPGDIGRSLAMLNAIVRAFEEFLRDETKDS